MWLRVQNNLTICLEYFDHKYSKTRRHVQDFLANSTGKFVRGYRNYCTI
jgi:hypothetical protein